MYVTWVISHGSGNEIGNSIDGNHGNYLHSNSNGNPIPVRNSDISYSFVRKLLQLAICYSALVFMFIFYVYYVYLWAAPDVKLSI